MICKAGPPLAAPIKRGRSLRPAKGFTIRPAAANGVPLLFQSGYRVFFCFFWSFHQPFTGGVRSMKRGWLLCKTRMKRGRCHGRERVRPDALLFCCRSRYRPMGLPSFFLSDPPPLTLDAQKRGCLSCKTSIKRGRCHDRKGSFGGHIDVVVVGVAPRSGYANRR